MTPSTATPRPSAGTFSPWSGLAQALTVLAICLAARLATTIHYVEDADSLRFALAMRDYDVTRLQPHFPGYPAFCFFAKGLYALTGRFAAAFSVLGGLGVFVLIHAALSLLKWRADSGRGLALIALFLCNPMFWLLGNRYMPDLTGAALAFAAFTLLAHPEARRGAMGGFFLAGLLAGWRLSYLPFLFAPLVWNLAWTDRRGEKLLAGVAGVLVWLVPFILITGWNDLLFAATRHTGGHFTEFGGTAWTESGWLLRGRMILEGVWTDGLGGWSPGRHPVTIAIGLGWVFFAARALFGGSPQSAEAANPDRSSRHLLLLSSLAYLIWIFLFQNVVHQTRHVLPLVPPLLMLAAGGFPTDWKTWRPARAFLPRAVAAAFLAAYAWAGTALAFQHKRPTAIAQAMDYVAAFPDPALHVVAPRLFHDYLRLQGVRARYLTLETRAERTLLDGLPARTPVITIGDYSDRIARAAIAETVFYHNPHVNRLWPRLEVYRHGDATARAE